MVQQDASGPVLATANGGADMNVSLCFEFTVDWSRIRPKLV